MNIEEVQETHEPTAIETREHLNKLLRENSVDSVDELKTSNSTNV